MASAVTRLSAPCVPETASDEALKRARAGEIINIKVAELILAAHCPNQQRNTEAETSLTQVLPESMPRKNLVPTDDGAPTTSGDDVDEANAPNGKRRRSEADATMEKGIEDRRLEIDAKKTLEVFRQGQLVHQDNVVQVFVRSVKRESGPTADEILYALQQAYQKARQLHPVQAIVAGTIGNSHAEENYLV